ncbi:MAG: hypothetical protein ACI9MC_002923, partial [Kiritimatiellia bacterium]
MRGSLPLLISMACGLALAAIAGTTLLADRQTAEPPPTPVRATIHHPRPIMPRPSAQAPQRTPQPLVMTDAARRLLEEAQKRATWSGGASVTCDVSALLPDGAASLAPDRGPLARSAIDSDYFLVSVVDGRLSFVVTEPSGEILVRSQNPDQAKVARLKWTAGAPGTTVSCDSAWATANSDHFVRIRVIEEDGTPEDPSMGLTFVQGCGMFFEATVTIGQNLPVESARCPMFVQRRHADLPLIVTRGDVVWIDPAKTKVTEVLLIAPAAPLAWQIPDIQELVVVGDLAAYHGMAEASDLAAAVAFDLVGGRWDPIEALDLLATWSGSGLSASNASHV